VFAAVASVLLIPPVTASGLPPVSASRFPPAPPPGGSTAGLAGAPSGAWMPGEVLVRFEPGASARERSRARSAAGVELQEAVGLAQTQLVSTTAPVGRAIRRLERQQGVADAQPNYRYEATAVPAPDDTFFGELWGLSDPAMPDPGVGALEAWENNKGAGETIAVLDTGVDLTHPDLVGNLWENPSPDPVDEDLHGFDFVDDDGDPDDYNFHGTHVAGTAAAVADNSLGVAGVAPNAEIMAVRVLDGDGSGSTVEIAEGIEYAADHGADVVNMSLGGPAGAGDKAMADAIEAAGAKGVVVVVAAGNEAADNEVEPESPCVLPQTNLICVAALSKSGALAGFSNYGVESVDLAAPGTSILSSKPDYGPPVFEDGFEGAPGTWGTAASGGGIPWGLSSSAATGLKSAADSPSGTYGHAAPGAEEPAASELFTVAPIDLTWERGCRVHFNSKYEIEPGFDVFLAGGISEAAAFDVAAFDGTSFGYPSSFFREEASVSGLDGRSDVHPFFGVFSDEEVDLDGAYVDDVRLFCRDETYTDAIATGSNYDQPTAGSYVRFQGTSMATPHVAGEVALVMAAAPSLDAEEVVQAVLDGTSAIPVVTTGKRTVTEGIADACKAIAVATNGDVATECPASSDPVSQPPNQGGVVPTPIPVGPVTSTPNPFPEPAPRSPRRKAPNTFFRQKPPKMVSMEDRPARVVFRFGSNEEDATFLCKLDRQRFRVCPRRVVRSLAPGPHVMRVKARDPDGRTDPTPAVYRFRVVSAGSS
jgi:subtilisin family serine protease